MKVKPSLEHQEPSFLSSNVWTRPVIKAHGAFSNLLEDEIAQEDFYMNGGVKLLLHKLSPNPDIQFQSLVVHWTISDFPIISKANILPRFLQLLQSKSAPPFTSKLCQWSGTIQHCIINAYQYQRWSSSIGEFQKSELDCKRLLSYPNPSIQPKALNYFYVFTSTRDQQGDNKSGVLFAEIPAKLRKIAKNLILLQMAQSLAIQLIMMF